MGEGVGGGDKKFPPHPIPLPPGRGNYYWSLGKPSLSSFVMFHMTKTLSLTEVRET